MANPPLVDGGKGRPSSAHLILLLILGLAFVLRVYHLDAISLSWDEVLPAAIAANDLAYLLTWLRSGVEIHPPLYYLIVHGWEGLGKSEFWLRFPSVVAGILTTAFIFQMGKLAYNSSAGAVAALLWAISAFSVTLSQQIRPYSFLTLLASAALVALLKALASPERRYVVGLAFMVGLALYVHYAALLFLVTLFLAFGLVVAQAALRTLWLRHTSVQGSLLAQKVTLALRGFSLLGVAFAAWGTFSGRFSLAQLGLRPQQWPLLVGFAVGWFILLLAWVMLPSGGKTSPLIASPLYWPRFRALGLALLLAMLLYTPWLPSFTHAMIERRGSRILASAAVEPSFSWQRWGQTLTEFVSPHIGYPLPPYRNTIPPTVKEALPEFMRNLPVTTVDIYFLFFLIGTLAVAKQRSQQLMLLLTVGLGPFMLLLFSNYSFNYAPRHMFFTWPLLLTFVSLGVVGLVEAVFSTVRRLARNNRAPPWESPLSAVAWASLAFAAILFGLLTAWPLKYAYQRLETDFRGAAAYLGQRAKPDDLVFAWDNDSHLGIGWYGTPTVQTLLTTPRAEASGDKDLWVVTTTEDPQFKSQTEDLMRASGFSLEASFRHLAIYRSVVNPQRRLTVSPGPWSYVDDFSSPKWLTDGYTSRNLRWAGYVPALTPAKDGQQGALVYYLQSVDGTALGPLALEVGGAFLVPGGSITASAGPEIDQWQPLLALDAHQPTARVSLPPDLASRSRVYLRIELWVSPHPQRYPTNMEYVQLRHVGFERR